MWSKLQGPIIRRSAIVVKCWQKCIYLALPIVEAVDNELGVTLDAAEQWGFSTCGGPSQAARNQEIRFQGSGRRSLIWFPGMKYSVRGGKIAAFG
jgi:hypothetical protein